METVLKKEIILSKALCRFIGVIIFIVLTTLGAFVRIPLPFSPVPLTLQTLFVLLSGACLGQGLGMVTQLSYLLLGARGLPIFTGTASGLIYFSGPTTGYLLGFVAAAFFLGRFIRYAADNFLSVLILFCLADLILLACGTLWLKAIFGYPLAKVFFIGFLPFLPGDLLKASAAAGIYLSLKPRLKEIF